MTSISEPTQVLIQHAWQVRQNNFLLEIYFDFPTQTKIISLTGEACALNCAHCGGHYLAGMTPVEELRPTSYQLPFRSALISGGCTPDGKVPFMGHLDLLWSLKEKIRLNFHVGLVDDEEIAQLEGLADIVSFDFVADQETIREVYGLEREPEDYLRVYRALRRKVPVMPHLTLGLKEGKRDGEKAALEVLEKEGVDGLTFIVFIPTPGTRYANRQPPKLEEVIEFLAKACALDEVCLHPVSREELELEICRGFRERMHICLEEAQLTSAEKDQADVLTAKYHSDEWYKIR